tara:strand:+ start:1067 stop:1288 length:222 start_codon:yes stop_codon:yes gene_type:complete
MGNYDFNLNYLAPNGFIGFWVLFIGLIFTSIMFYFVFFNLNDNDDSYRDKLRKKLEKDKQRQRIERLYPKENQ